MMNLHPKRNKRGKIVVINLLAELNNFLNQLFATENIPHTSTFMWRGKYKLTIQYSPNKGFVVGYQDIRVKEHNYTMMWADLVLQKDFDCSQEIISEMCSKILGDEDKFRDFVMNSNELPQSKEKKELPPASNIPAEKIHTEFQQPIHIQSSKDNLREVIEDVGRQAVEMYEINSKMYLKE